MSLAPGSLSFGTFERLYQGNADPWRFATSPYERGRYAAMLRVLSREQYATAFEPGCSIGEFTALLAPRCARFLAIDVSHTAVAAARGRCSAFAHVTIDTGALPMDIPNEALDLIIFSEIGYYFTKPDLTTLSRTLFNRLQAGGEFLAVHWLGHSVDHPLHGDEAVQVLHDALHADTSKSERHEGFRIDLWTKP